MNKMADWSCLTGIFTEEEQKNINDFIGEEMKNYTLFPKNEDIFNVFKYCDFKDTKVVLLGQDPYHGEGQATGLCFSVPSGFKKPPSLCNIFKEIHDDTGSDSICSDGDLTPWAKQGILLLNTALTVRKGKPNSHKKFWSPYTDKIIKHISDNSDDGIIFILWGNNAISKWKFIDEKRHHIFSGVHPSPLSAYRGFFGSKVFTKVNAKLTEMGKMPILW